jgi:phosphotransferase system  glucose/maltose/N-acetylglucosamine-specific IIC component
MLILFVAPVLFLVHAALAAQSTAGVAASFVSLNGIFAGKLE